jgi:2-amino-4-hydroxy-6-hydroxymethyldihydropteridine diphosphokinase
MNAYLSIGSNIHAAKNIPACIRKLKKTFRVKKISSIYETSPVGPVGKRRFWNLAVQIETSLSRPKLREALRSVESELGRKRSTDKFAPRPIDIDLIGYHKSWRKGFEKFAFVLFPLAEIAPYGQARGPAPTFAELVRRFSDSRQKIRIIREAGPPEKN